MHSKFNCINVTLIGHNTVFIWYILIDEKRIDYLISLASCYPSCYQKIFLLLICLTPCASCSVLITIYVTDSHVKIDSDHLCYLYSASYSSSSDLILRQKLVQNVASQFLTLKFFEFLNLFIWCLFRLGPGLSNLSTCLYTLCPSS